MEGILGNDMGWSILFALTVVPGIFQVKMEYVIFIFSRIILVK